MMQHAADTLGIRIGSTTDPHPEIAAAALRHQLGQEGMGLAVVFASSRYDLEALAGCLRREFGQVPVVGCTTAGEIGPLGYTEGGLSGFSLAEDEVTVEIGLIDGVSGLQNRRGQAFAYGLRQRLAGRLAEFDTDSCFALLLVDGLCLREENVALALYDGLGGIPLVGGSAGDDLDFCRTAVLYDGRFHHDAALLLVASTQRRVMTFKTQHFVCASRRLVVTGAQPERRVATEIDGFPAAEEYARVIGLDPAQLNPMVFSAHPMVVKVGGADFVRSVQKVNPDGSMTFYCAIDEGIVFNVAEGVDMVANLAALFEDVGRRIGPPSLVIGCDCILRRLEMGQKGLIDDVAAIMRRHNVVGFSTYGEQFRGMHVNQTFTGIAFGPRTHA